MGTTRFFGSIRKLSSGRYQARYRHLGRRIAADVTFGTKAATRAYLASVETDLARGTYREIGHIRTADDEADLPERRPGPTRPTFTTPAAGQPLPEEPTTD